jgi:putative phage-type endonuclease
MLQRDEQWHQERIGKITASRMKDLMARSKKDGKPLKAASDYMEDLLAERLTGKQKTIPTTYAMERGTMMEPQGLAAYSAAAGVFAEDVPFTPHPDLPYVGASPDGEIGEDGLVELKCPESITKHVTYLRDGAHVEEYWWQVQCQLWVTDRAWCDLVSYHPDFQPGLQLAIRRVEPDAEAFEQMKAACLEAEAKITAALSDIQKLAEAA